ncbi:hypothetical protein GE09DRAFT_746022 [Coniochaeta sp. 2T2.1]|nr:hypothetical protein GE09DRAFT_746022 [Coniochaeta sp. 2T2.1]
MAGTLVSASPVTRDVADGVLGGYLNSCRNIKGFYLWGDQGSVTDLWISGECMDIGGNFVKSQMDVNPCYKNINAQIVPVTDGSGDIAHSCDYCQLFPDWTYGWMSCMCYMGGADTRDSGYFVGNVDLSECGSCHDTQPIESIPD